MALLVDVNGLVQPVPGKNNFKVNIPQEDWKEGDSGLVVTIIRRGEKIKDVSVSKDGDRSWTVTYNVSQDGEYEFIITVDGVEAKNSPFKRFWYAEPIKGIAVDIGQDWKWGRQHEGGNGVLLGYGKDVRASENWVKVRWKNGRQNNYRWGAEGAYDILLLTAPPPQSPPPTTPLSDGSNNKQHPQTAAASDWSRESVRELVQETSVLQARLDKKGEYC